MISYVLKKINFLSYIILLILKIQGISNAIENEQDPQIRFQSFSSEISRGTIGANILNIVNNARTSIIIASDQCTNSDFLDRLLTLRNQRPTLMVGIVIGDDSSRNRNRSILRDDAYQAFTRNYVPVSEEGAKMHNKFIVVDDNIVITGSPNLTFPAHNRNIESFVSIENQNIAQIYRAYYEYIIDQQNDEARINVINLMHLWNSRLNAPIHVCLAPFSSISDFIIERINDANVVSISMFLISRATQHDGDIVSHLVELGDRVTVKVDEQQYNTKDFMRTAIAELTDNGVRVSTVSKYRAILHDKLILIRYRDGNMPNKVIIGSAGFTTHVQDNLNFENMVSITDDTTYNFLMAHFNSIQQNRTGIRVNDIVQ